MLFFVPTPELKQFIVVSHLQIAPNAKKIWEDDQKEQKPMFPGGPNPWSAPRDDAWGNSQQPTGEPQPRFQQRK